MHGLMYFCLHQFADEVGSPPRLWELAHRHQNLPLITYFPSREYEDEPFSELIQGIAALRSESVDSILEAYGTFVGPHLIAVSQPNIVRGTRTLELLFQFERLLGAILGSAPQLHHRFQLQLVRESPDDVVMLYTSPRKLCALVRGLLRGFAQHYGEQIAVEESTCMHHGAPFCTVQIHRATGALPEPNEPRSGEIARTNATDATHVIALVPISQPMTELTLPPKSNAELQLGLLSEEATIGSYAIECLIGQGSMGQVYRCTDLLLHRKVAVKVMHPHLATDSLARQRFLREARAAAALNHPNLVTIYQVGQHGERPFLAMQYLEGMSLEQFLLENRCLGLREIARIGAEVAAGLAAAHSIGLIHRDVKPENIWLESPNRHVRLLDFGLAHDERDPAHLTLSGVLVGTPAYMSPEQASGESCTPASDLFSLGVILYRMAAGKLPFQAKSILSMVQAIVLNPVPPLSEKCPHLPSEFLDLVHELLIKTPTERLSSAETVCARLGELQKRVTSGSMMVEEF